MGYRGRFAPSPTGQLHLGGACTALCAWLAARAQSGTFVLRIEDLDTARVRAKSEQDIEEDLLWLGLDWDEGPIEGPFGPYHQSERGRLYQEALDKLGALGMTYFCDCSRKEVERCASAPHAGDDGAVYPGTCRDLPQNRVFRRAPAVRFRVPCGAEVTFEDAVHGPQRVDLSQQSGDFVLRRGDGVVAYQLAAAVDDVAQGITQVVRGADLLGSTARQLMVMRLLAGREPTYAHAPLVLDLQGNRLAKRACGVSVRDYRVAGVHPSALIARLAHVLGLANSNERRLTADELVHRFAWSKIPKGPVRIDTRVDG